MKISNIIKTIPYTFFIIPLSSCGTIIKKFFFEDWEIEAMDCTKKAILFPIEDTSTYGYRYYTYVSDVDGEKPYVIDSPNFDCDPPISIYSQFCKSSWLVNRHLLFPTFIFETVALEKIPDKDEKIFIVTEESKQNQNLVFQAFEDMLKKPNIKISKAVPILFKNGDANYKHYGYFVYLDNNNSFKKQTKFYAYVTQ
jgi:hypothetical protein